MEGIGVEKVKIPVTGGSLFRRQVVIDIVTYIEDVNKLKERLCSRGKKS